MPRNKSLAKFSWTTIPVEDQRHLLSVIGGDGHTIWTARYLAEEGVNHAIISAFSSHYKSNKRDFKQTITVNGLVVDEMEGIYGLTVLWSLANHHGVESDKMGRGSQAQELTQKIRAKLAVDIAREGLSVSNSADAT